MFRVRTLLSIHFFKIINYFSLSLSLSLSLFLCLSNFKTDAPYVPVSLEINRICHARERNSGLRDVVVRRWECAFQRGLPGASHTVG